jgi:cytosolic iron-sulfur protein assembly protein CIAO1
MEKWVEHSTLPEVHVRSVYAVDWSRRTGLVVSCGGDGTIAVYKEVLDDTQQDVIMNGTSEEEQQQHESDESGRKSTKWIVVAIIEGAHEEYEVNHVCWATRRDKDKRWDGEEALVSTGDDGDVRIWTLPDEIVDEAWKAK